VKREWTAMVQGINGELLRSRKHYIDQAQRLVEETEKLDHRYREGFDIDLKFRPGTYAELRSALEARQLRIVVIGEFSRGKSYLINALLGQRVLPVADKPTTAINTFVHYAGGGVDPYVKILWQDPDKEDLVLPWVDDGVIQAWGTELDKENVDARREVRKIEAYTDHPLFANDLTIIDTPGFESLLPQHEKIAHQAIAEAHVAIWVLTAWQLGGNASEWKFLNQTVAKNFNKFLTVVNAWDLILQPTDLGRREIPEEVRVEEGYEEIRKNFRQQAQNLSDEQKSKMTDADHLLGVSALWALSSDPVQQARSGIDRLGARIETMCTTGEAYQEILAKPLLQIVNLQDQIRQDVIAQIELLEREDKLDELERERERLELELERHRIDMTQKRRTYEGDHSRNAHVMTRAIQDRLVQPMRELGADLDEILTPQLVEEQLEEGLKNVGLPASFRGEFEKRSEQLDETWRQLRSETLQILTDLRDDFEREMAKETRRIEGALEDLRLDIGDIEVTMDVDLGAVEAHFERKQALRGEIEEITAEIEDIETELVQTPDHSHERQLAEARIRRAQERLDGLGPQPAVGVKQKTEHTETGMWRKDIYKTVNVPDYTNVDRWEKQRAKLEANLADQEAAIDAIVEQEKKRNGKVLTRQAAKRRLEVKRKKEERELARLAEKLRGERAKAAAMACKRLRRSTVDTLARRATDLETNVATAVEQAFTSQLEQLLLRVEEQFAEPLSVHGQQLEATIEQIKKGTEAVALRKQELTALLDDLDVVVGETADLRDLVAEIADSGRVG